MKRYLILLILPILACNGLSTPLPPPTGGPASPTSTGVSPTQPPPLTPAPPTEPNASTFPNADAYTWQFVADGLERPVDLQPDPQGRLWIVEKLGHIHLFQNGQLNIDTPFLDIEDRVNDESNEMGLLGLALHPNFAQNGYFYVNYTGARGDTFISRFTAGENSVDPNSELILLRVKQPYPNHNGGTMNFGPDGYLYMGLGDGGSGGAQHRIVPEPA